MRSLVIGNTSQQSYFYPNDFLKISSRNLDMEKLQSESWDTIVIAFAEQRIYDSGIDYFTPNFLTPLEIIRRTIRTTRKILVFTSCELWTNCSGVIHSQTPVNFSLSNRYTLSKFLLFDEIKRLRKRDSNYEKVVIVHPFYFNSTFRSKYFLFGKIFDSIINKKKIQVGNLDFYRDMVHTSFFVDKCLQLESDHVLGSGSLFNVRNFVIDLYQESGLDFFEFVSEDKSKDPNDKPILAGVSWEYTYKELLQQTLKDLEKNGSKENS